VLGLSGTTLQAWIAALAALATGALGILKYFNYRSRRDRISLVGEAFAQTVEGLSSEAEAKQLAAAVLLRRFFDKETEQGAAGTPYEREAIAVIAALLRNTETGELQKLLADGLAYATSLHAADLQRCNLSRAYLGKRPRATVTHGGARSLGPKKGVLGRRDNATRADTDDAEEAVDLTKADLFQATLVGASLRGANARDAVFYEADARKAVFEEAHLECANFRNANLDGARFADAYLCGADFQGATGVPSNVEQLLDEHRKVPEKPGIRVRPL
jgi:uncharacterized protein YjbI with pentapeptide repeats